jgi:hypothetical protein
VEWLDKGVKWKNEFPLTELTPVDGRRRKAKLEQRNLEKDVPTMSKKLKLIKSNITADSIEKDTKDARAKAKRDVPVDESATIESSEHVSSDRNEFKVNRKEVASTNDAHSDDSKPTAMAKTYDKAPDLWEVTGVAKDQGLTQVTKLLPKGDKKCAKQVIHFFLFCLERQLVWERRNREECNSEGYYTESWAMQSFFFCNVSTGGIFVSYAWKILTILLHRTIESSIAELVIFESRFSNYGTSTKRKDT